MLLNISHAARSMPEPSSPSYNRTHTRTAPAADDELDNRHSRTATNGKAPRRNSWHFKDTPPPMPECWGHRGASGAFPENTLASFERAVADGAEGIESG
ncbi:hypothetical protein K437DRAFT_268026 [Tilletiaria anomala UBC 951]|uniref:GP-PDE domain-containing protein n=1 Tax=Tilletiaria anomala (strain ATCC 24038 / CBS 436.72 / UBC 951) TaxID=1037660 RepID=A0A066VZA2_TILAU|nr:uncharacterized protein K437DRAFT_268026 [Tilletiaria anomala UBC 951]KDN46806.1 hypothetical protein K437DRAFT_268026 [Tilletiaria anomala UBC 951]